MIENATIISDAHGHINVHYIYNATGGWTHDMGKATYSKWTGMLTPISYRLVEKWRELIEEMGGVNGGGKIIHYAHSIGGTYSYQTKYLLTPEERKMIHITTVGSASLPEDNDNFGTFTNYISVRDGVPFTDPIGYLRGLLNPNTNINFIGSIFDGLPLIDHLFTSNSYTQLIAELGAEFVRIHGAVRE